MFSGHHLPDKTMLVDIDDRVPGRLRLGYVMHRYPGLTVGELRRMDDFDLSLIPYVGKTTRKLIREFFGVHQELDAASPADIPDVIRELRKTISGLEERIARLEA